MMDRWTDRLSEYVDDTLQAGERAQLETHLNTCAECRDVLEDLRGVVARAHALEDRGPARDLWPGVAREIAPPQIAPRAWRLAFSVPQLLAASIALMLVSAGGAWLAVRGRGAPQTVSNTTATPQATNVSWTADPRYDAAIGELRAALESGRKSGRLDSATIRVVEHNLAIIDTAIVQARRALTADPHSSYLNQHLADTMRRKLDLLRQATAIAAART